jgi:hypothetical protein
LQRKIILDLFLKTSENENNKNCIYKYFYIIVKSHLNISFTNPCNDLCKTCFKWKNHQKLRKENNCRENCNQCISYKIHMNEVKTVRRQYRNDTSAQILSSNAENNLPKLLVVSLDTQKILQIPKMPIKDNYFAERIGVTNFTIAQTGIEGYVTFHMMGI